MDRRAELLAAIEADPDALENWLVYADWLSERGDVRGELIMLELAIEANLATDDVLARRRAILRHDEALMSSQLAEHWHHLDLDYWRGFIRGARVFGPADDPPPPEVVHALYADPHACLLHRLSLLSNADLLPHAASERIRELQLSGAEHIELELDAWFPQLDALELYSEGPPDELAHPRLARLAVSGDCSALRSRSFTLPGLTTLELDGDGDDDMLDLFEPGAILADPPPALASLTMRPWSRETAARLRDSRLLPQLRSLTCRIDDEILDAMPPDRFGHLTITATGGVETIAQRDALLARCAQLLPRARLEIGTTEEARRDLRGRAAPPPVAANLAHALSQIAERLRRRGPRS